MFYRNFALAMAAIITILSVIALYFFGLKTAGIVFLHSYAYALIIGVAVDITVAVSQRMERVGGR